MPSVPASLISVVELDNTEPFAVVPSRITTVACGPPAPDGASCFAHDARNNMGIAIAKSRIGHLLFASDYIWLTSMEDGNTPFRSHSAQAAIHRKSPDGSRSFLRSLGSGLTLDAAPVSL